MSTPVLDRLFAAVAGIE
jgi:hypothetical protein